MFVVLYTWDLTRFYRIHSKIFRWWPKTSISLFQLASRLRSLHGRLGSDAMIFTSNSMDVKQINRWNYIHCSYRKGCEWWSIDAAPNIYSYFEEILSEFLNFVFFFRNPIFNETVPTMTALSSLMISWTRYKYELHSRRCVRTQVLLWRIIYSHLAGARIFRCTIYMIMSGLRAKRLIRHWVLHLSIVCAVLAEHVPTHSECQIKICLTSTMLRMWIRHIFRYTIYSLHIIIIIIIDVMCSLQAEPLNSTLSNRFSSR